MSLFLKILRWSAISIVVAFAALVVYRMFVLRDKQKTDEQVIKIHATKLTLDDVMGKNLPPPPGADANKTVQGVDANKNGVYQTARKLISLQIHAGDLLRKTALHPLPRQLPGYSCGYSGKLRGYDLRGPAVPAFK